MQKTKVDIIEVVSKIIFFCAKIFVKFLDTTSLLDFLLALSVSILSSVF